MDGTVRRLSGAELTPQGLYGVLRLRVDVFVVEQRCAYAELDGRDLDPGTVHLVIGPDCAPLAYLRLLGEPGGERRIGRVCTAPAARNHGLGRRLLAAALREVGDAPCVLDAQEHLTALYGELGFVPSGPGYDWDGVPHVPMRRPSGGTRLDPPSRAPRKEDTGT
jgi:ElaA protein